MGQTDGAYSLIPQPPTAVPRTKSGLATLFFGPDGLRAGWRLLLFVVILAGIVVSLRLILATLIRIPSPATVQFSATAEIVGVGSTLPPISLGELDHGQDRGEEGRPLRTGRLVSVAS